MADKSCANGSTVSQKRLRNRLAQQAFRKRQSLYIKDLERRLEIKGNNDSEQITRLSSDNRALREQLSTACRKLERIQITLSSLSESMLSHVSSDSVSDLEATSTKQTNECAPDRGNKCTINGDTMVVTTQNQLRTASHTASGNTDECDDQVSNLQLNRDTEQTLPLKLLDALPTDGDYDEEASSFPLDPTYQALQDPMELDVSRLLGSFSDVRSLPGIWTHEYQMGVASFQARSPSADKMTQGLGNTNSSFSDHMQMIRGCLKIQWRKATHVWTDIEASQVTSSLIYSYLRLTWFRDGLRLCATVLLSHFHSLNRPAALAWYTATRFQENITDLLLWQINRSPKIYSRMHANYRPSALQLLEDYPSVIDWCPFPTIRDKLILLHSANPYLDQIICDIATAYVVEVDADRFVFGQAGRAYIRVWDLICAFDGKDIEDDVVQDITLINGELLSPELPDGHQTPLLPAPNVHNLFQPPYARLAFKALGLDDGVPRFKVDPSLFTQYPELYDSGADILATGTAIAPDVQTKIPPPALPRQDTMTIYRNVADWCANAICRALLGQNM